MGNTKSTSNVDDTNSSQKNKSEKSKNGSIKSFPESKEQERYTLSDKDLSFLRTQTGLSPDEIIDWHKRFFHENPDGRLDRAQFGRFYSLLRNEPPERLSDICNHIFRAFDVDGNGYVEFGEFLLGFAVTSHGDLRSRLDYAFECYDLDSNGYLTEDEIALVLRGMYNLLGIQHIQDFPPEELAKDLMAKLDVSKDGRVTKDEFIYYLMKDGIYRNTVNPFR